MTTVTSKLLQEEAWCRGCQSRLLSSVGEKNGFGLLRCAACGTVIVDPYPTDSELADFYSSYHMTDNYIRKESSKVRRGMGRVRRLLRAKPPGKKFLDVGCSTGTVVEAARQLGLTAHGIDISSEAVNVAKKNYGGSASFETIAIGELAARGDMFDMVYTSEVIEHVRDPEGFIADIARVMNPGAVLYLTAPDGGHFSLPGDFSKWSQVCPPEHLTYFTRRGIICLLQRHGLRAEGFQIAFKPGLKVLARKS
ncbi:MAG: methyltransferase domain-containing protein [Proteobacteria bacterium]|nr:methyltransferase domain-containing protein [Pseudomonadota bacterium]